MNFLRVIWILWMKDWRTEARTWQIVPLSVVLIGGAVMVLNLLPTPADLGGREGNVYLWFITLMVLVIILDRALAGEVRNDVIDGLFSGPVSSLAFVVSKTFYAGSLLVGLQGLTIVLLREMLGVQFDDSIARLIAMVLLTDLGLVLIGIVCSLISQQVRYRTAMLASMVWPMSLPLIYLAVGGMEAEGQGSLLIIAGFNLVLMGFLPGVVRMVLGK